MDKSEYNEKYKDRRKYVNVDEALGWVETNDLWRKGRMWYMDLDTLSNEDIEEEFHWNFPAAAKEDLPELILDALMNSTISPKQTLVIKLLFFQGHTQAEITEILGVSRQAVSKLKIKALRNLRRYLEKKLIVD